MIRMTVAILLTGLAAVAAAGEAVDQRIDAAPDSKVSIDVVRGSVIVEAWNENAVHVQGTRDDKSEEFIFERSGRDIRIEDDLKNRSNGSNERGTHITVRIPRGASVEIDTVSADQTVSGIQGGARLEAVSGDIRASSIERELRASTVSGELTVTKARGDIRLDSVSGDIVAEVDTDRLDVDAISGDATVSNAGRVARLEGSVVSGDLEVATGLAPGARVNLESISGDIQLGLHGDIDARFSLETGPGGDIENGLSDEGPRRERYTGAENLEFQLGSGDAEVDASVVSGEIVLKRR